MINQTDAIKIRQEEGGTKDQKNISYVYEFTIQNEEKYGIIQPPLQDKILVLTKENSQLVLLQEKELPGLLALERYSHNDVQIAVEVMESFGFYSSRAEFIIDEKTKPYTVHMRLIPGKQYAVGVIEVRLASKETIPAAFLQSEGEKKFLFWKRAPSTIPKFPKSLPTVHKGDAAIATDILSAVDTLARPLRENGYPTARVTSSAFSLNKKKHLLNGTVFFNQGLPATMGDVHLSGNAEVSSQYIQRLRPWKLGAMWDERYLLEYREILQKTGLFQTVKIRFDPRVARDSKRERRERRKQAKQGQKDDSEGTPLHLPVLLEVTEANERSISGAVYYSTDKGPGFRTTWEHRNFFGNGENVRLSLPLSRDEYLLMADFRKPAFMFPKQTLLLKTAMGYEKTDAYTKDYIEFAAGIEREIHTHWWLESLVYVDTVAPDDVGSGYDEPDYSSVKWTNTLRYDARNKEKDSTKGIHSSIKFSPLYGFDSEAFYSFAMEVDASVYYPLSEKLILGVRVATGIMPGSPWERIPRTKRFFLGGGGTVRGYSYQELGKHDANDEPLGGLSYTLVNVEMRIRMAKNIDVVPFLDGGMVYESVEPKWGQDIAWGTGIGLRYNTPIGPIRFDIAVPLNDATSTKRTSISDFKIYLSIGQAF